MCRRGAVFVDKVLRGVKPADIPVEQATKFETVLNIRAANCAWYAEESLSLFPPSEH